MKRAVIAAALVACGGLFEASPPDDAGAPKDATHESSAVDVSASDAPKMDAPTSFPLSFTTQTIPTGLLFPDAVEVADVTGDGRADVIIAGVLQNNTAGVFVFAQTSNGSLASPVWTAMNAYLAALTPGDVTNDGRVDLVFGTKNGLGVAAQSDAGTLLPLVTYDGTDAGSAGDQLTLGRFSASGLLDVAQEHLSGTQAIWLWHQTPTGFVNAGEHAPGEYELTASGDLDGDGRDDIVVSDVGPAASLQVVRQTSVGVFGTPTTHLVSSSKSTIEGLAVGDVTGDSRSDIVVSYGGNTPSSHLAVVAQAAGTLALPTIYDTLDNPETVRLADMDGDGRLDVVVSHSGFADVSIYLQSLNGSLGAEQLFPFHNVGAGRGKSIAIGDVNGDGRNDVVGVAWPDNAVLLLLQ